MRKNIFNKILLILSVILMLVFITGCYQQEIVEEIAPEVYPYMAAYKITAKEPIKVRKSSSTLADQIGKIDKGTTMMAYSKEENEGYSWFELAPNEWVANDGTWLIVKEIEVENDDFVDKSQAKLIRALKNIKIKSFPSQLAEDTGCEITKTTHIYMFGELFDGRNLWYKIGENEWIMVENKNLKFE